MDDFMNKNDIDDNASAGQPVSDNTETSDFAGSADGNIPNETTQSDAFQNTAENPSEQNAQQFGYPPFDNMYTAPQNRINYTVVLPVRDYKPMSKGLKVFSGIMAAVILMTAASVAGYFLGRSSVKTTAEISVDLAAKPADTDEMTAAQVYDKVNDSVVGYGAWILAEKKKSLFIKASWFLTLLFPHSTQNANAMGTNKVRI